jgi:MoCo/4Fe-4S cofactor protein with predicted Tat translocation signal
MSSMTPPSSGQQYWRSLDDLADSPEFRQFVEQEFPNFAPELLEGPTRRRFLKVMGASLAFAGLTGCRWPKEKILPFADRPANRTPGIPVQYATAMEIDGVAQGLLASSFDGRPIKIEGNDRHPSNRGKTDIFAQASILDLYDPDRLQRPLWEGQEAHRGELRAEQWSRFEKSLSTLRDQLAESNGDSAAILYEPTSSPVFAALKDELSQRYPELMWVEFASNSRDNEREGLALALGGTPQRPLYDLTAADVIVSFDSDFLLKHPDSVRLTRDFAARRRPDAGNHYDINRLYVFESQITLTGGRADHRAGVRPDLIAPLVRALHAAVHGDSSLLVAMQSQIGSRIDLAKLVEDLQAHQGKSVLIAGPQHSPEVHAAIAQLNADLGNTGHTLRYAALPDAKRASHFAAYAALLERIKDRKIDQLLILGGNPASSFGDVEIKEAMVSIDRRWHLTVRRNETSEYCEWVIPQAHYLESWDIVRAYDGTASVVQPLIAPLFEGRTPAQMLAMILGKPNTTPHALTKDYFAKHFASQADLQNAWKQALSEGMIAKSAATAQSPAARFDVGLLPSSADLPAPSQDGAGFDLVFTADYSTYDGRFGNNAWMQENPDPITKLTWDNAALVSPADARAMNIDRGTRLMIEVGGRQITIPAFIQPGVPKGVIVLPLGYGLKNGVVAREAGVAVEPLRTVAAPWFARSSKITRQRSKVTLATTQDHHYMESSIGKQEIERRVDRLVRETTVGELQHHPGVIQHKVHLPVIAPVFEQVEYTGDNQWAMAVDLSACTGCSACQVACTAENNIPVVGKDEIYNGREMHWMRIDRYFKGDPDDIDGLAVQPVTCHHCENAPCEQVCPVGATMHDEEGLNTMVYNRCIGTRYCSNNCPYKVRRFNWFWNHHGPSHPRGAVELNSLEKMHMNPRVTVRSRGVMEKCTFCSQRISDVRVKAKNEGRPIADGEVTPACAQACPADAIVFGDLNDPSSRINKLREHDRSYFMLAELNVRPRVNYLGRVNNPVDGGSHESNGHGGGHNGAAHSDNSSAGTHTTEATHSETNGH